jgi:uncharacterized membrane protein YeiB
VNGPARGAPARIPAPDLARGGWARPLAALGRRSLSGHLFQSLAGPAESVLRRLAYGGRRERS